MTISDVPLMLQREPSARTPIYFYPVPEVGCKKLHPLSPMRLALNSRWIECISNSVESRKVLTFNWSIKGSTSPTDPLPTTFWKQNPKFSQATRYRALLLKTHFPVALLSLIRLVGQLFHDHVSCSGSITDSINLSLSLSSSHLPSTVSCCQNCAH